MSIWVQYDVTAYGDQKAIGRFFHLDPNEDIHCIDNFSFSFGQRNIPGLRFAKLVEQNPDLIFLVKENIEFDEQIFLQRFDIVSKTHQIINIQERTDAVKDNIVNKKLLDEFTLLYPDLVRKHIMKISGFEEYRWSMVLRSFTNMATILSNADQYQEMVSPMEVSDLEFDNSILE